MRLLATRGSFGSLDYALGIPRAACNSVQGQKWLPGSSQIRYGPWGFPIPPDRVGKPRQVQGKLEHLDTLHGTAAPKQLPPDSARAGRSIRDKEILFTLPGVVPSLRLLRSGQPQFPAQNQVALLQGQDTGTVAHRDRTGSGTSRDLLCNPCPRPVPGLPFSKPSLHQVSPLPLIWTVPTSLGMCIGVSLYRCPSSSNGHGDSTPPSF